eukprot:COSAG05_NODE_167_length_15185_cov_7.875779_5_plen_64_part_00
MRGGIPRAVAALDLIWARPERAMAVVSHGAIMAELFRSAPAPTCAVVKIPDGILCVGPLTIFA